MFQMLFERSADAIVLFDPEAGVFVDCNPAAVALLRAASKEQLLNASPADLSPPLQADGVPSAEKSQEITALVQRNGSHRFEWLARRLDGVDVPLECLATAVPLGDRTLHVVAPRDISERKRAEEEIRQLNQTLEQRVADRTAELRASETQFRTLVEHAPEAIVVLDGMTGRFEMVNENAVRLFGRSREELLRLAPADVSPACQPDGKPSADLAREKMEAALAGANPVFEWVHRHASGRLFASEVRLVRLRGERCCLLRASIIDHTERKRREQVQRATYEISEAVHAVNDLPSLYARIHRIVSGLMPARNFYLALFDAASGLISFPYIVDEQADEMPAPRPLGSGLTGVVLRTGKPLLVTKSMARQARRQGDAVVLEGVEVPYVESGAPAAIWLGAPLMGQGRAFGVMAVQDYQDETSYGDSDKQLLAFVATQTALAIERKRAEQALRESEEKFRALFEATSTGVMIHDECQYLEVNPAIVRMFGYPSAADLVGKNPVVTSPPFQPGGIPTAEQARRHIADCTRHGTARFEWLARRADGSDFPVEVILTRIEMGGRQLMEAVVNDISERKKAEAELLKALAREQELGQLKSNFVSMVSHEFRTPLGVIQSSAEILNDYLDRLDEAERREHLQSIVKNTRRMAAMMEEVLVLGRLDAGKMECQPRPVNLRALLGRLVDEAVSASGRACPIELQWQGSLEEARADERLLRHIFSNLLSNAVKYSEPGRAVRFHVQRDGNGALFTVRDQGIGIPEPDQAWLFNAFHRGGNVGARPGTGLGLVIVKRCVELHGGRIQVDSKLGKGATVTVQLPLFPSPPTHEKNSRH